MGENLLEGGEATVAVFPVVEEPWPEQLPPTTRALLGLGAAVLAGCIGGRRVGCCCGRAPLGWTAGRAGRPQLPAGAA